jgi:hypothetical protein
LDRCRPRDRHESFTGGIRDKVQMEVVSRLIHGIIPRGVDELGVIVIILCLARIYARSADFINNV